MIGHWNQIWQGAICPTKHKCKCKNQNLSYQQAQNNDLIDQSQNSYLIWYKKFVATSPKSLKDLALIDASQLNHGSFGHFLEINVSWF